MSLDSGQQGVWNPDGRISHRWPSNILVYPPCQLNPGVTLGLSGNQSVERIKGNQATFDNSQRNNLRSHVWFRWDWFGSVVSDVRVDFLSSRLEISLLLSS